MQKLLHTLAALLFVYASTQAQVAINTDGSTPNASAILDIQSASKGVLFPRVFLSSTVDKTTVPSPAFGLIVQNMNTQLTRGAGLYVNNGTAQSPNWQWIGELRLPYYQATSTNNNAFHIENYSGTVGSVAMRAFSQGGSALFAQSSSGYALEASGKVKISGFGQAPGLGKVLTSDAAGNATWEGGIAFSANGIQAGGAAEVAPGVLKKVAFVNEEYDLSNNFNPAAVSPHSTFTAPVKGIYHFDALVSWLYDGDDFRSSLYLVRERAGVRTTLAEQEIRKFYGTVSNQFSRDCLLLPGDMIWVEIGISGSDNWKLNTDASANYFNGRLVMKL